MAIYLALLSCITGMRKIKIENREIKVVVVVVVVVRATEKN